MVKYICTLLPISYILSFLCPSSILQTILPSFSIMIQNTHLSYISFPLSFQPSFLSSISLPLLSDISFCSPILLPSFLSFCPSLSFFLHLMKSEKQCNCLSDIPSSSSCFLHPSLFLHLRHQKNLRLSCEITKYRPHMSSSSSSSSCI